MHQENDLVLIGLYVTHELSILSQLHLVVLALKAEEEHILSILSQLL
ncbi:MAG: hypothetical protein N3E41_08685 [Thermofilaceae archaeon]|nr:hypothetical protein [Thermofilaceae archaeon]